MNEKMNPTIKAAWVAALRSGEYKQGTSCLRTSSNAFCCAGVLCNLHAQANPEIAATQTDPKRYLDEWQWPANEVFAWAGLPRGGPERVLIQGFSAYLWQHNDGRNVPHRTFAEIADAIEEQL